MASFHWRPANLLKEQGKSFLLKHAGLRRIHLVGCARSGTTMLHYAMIAFSNTILFDKETAPWSAPGLGLCYTLWRQASGRHDLGFFITKRHANWWRPAQISRLADYARRYDVFLINLIRDPRDVLTSRHPLDRKQYYVAPDLWRSSVAAARRLEQEMAGSSNFLTVKYEDVIRQSHRLELLLQHRLGLCLRPHLRSWRRLKENLQASNVSARMLPYMHRLRDFDESAIGKWRRDPAKAAYLEHLLQATPHGASLRAYLAEHGYADDHAQAPAARPRPLLESA